MTLEESADLENTEALIIMVLLVISLRIVFNWKTQECASSRRSTSIECEKKVTLLLA